jgi:isopenicillin-N epimerase
MQSRKNFLKYTAGIAAASAGLPLLRLENFHQIIEDIQHVQGSSDEIARNEDYWHYIQQAFTVDRSIINLNNGGVSPSPAVVQDAMKRHLDYSNKAPTYTMWRFSTLKKRVSGKGLRSCLAWIRKK